MGVQNLFTLHFGNSSRLNNLTTKSILTPYRSFWWYHAAFLSRLILSSHSFFSKFPFFSQHSAELLSHVGEVERKIVIWQQEKCARLKTERSPYASLQACWQSLEWRFILDLVNSRFVFFFLFSDGGCCCSRKWKRLIPNKTRMQKCITAWTGTHFLPQESPAQTKTLTNNPFSNWP